MRSVRKNIPSVSSEFRHHANIHLCYKIRKYVILKHDFWSRVDVIIPYLQKKKSIFIFLGISEHDKTRKEMIELDIALNYLYLN